MFRRSARAPGEWAKDKTKHKDEVAALLLGIELGMTLIDTAEMYQQFSFSKKTLNSQVSIFKPE